MNPKGHINQSDINVVFQKQSRDKSTFQFVDNRPKTVIQRKLQNLANNSSSVSQLKIIQKIVNSSHANSTIVQLQVSDVEVYLQKVQKGFNHFGNPSLPTKQEVINFAKDSRLDVSIRRELVKAWNINQSPPLVIDESLIGFTSELRGSMSPTAKTHDGVTRNFTGLANGVLFTQSTGVSRPIPLVQGLIDSAMLIRSNEQNKNSDSNSFNQPFFVQLGDWTNLIQSPRGNDYVYTSVKQTTLSGEYQRTGRICTWSTLLSNLNHEYSKRFKQVMKNIIGIFLEGVVPLNKLVFDVACAMTCDAKYSIQGLKLFIKEIETGLSNYTLYNFNQVFGKSGVYKPAQIGGRKETAYRRDNASEDEKKDL